MMYVTLMIAGDGIFIGPRPCLSCAVLYHHAPSGRNARHLASPPRLGSHDLRPDRRSPSDGNYRIKMIKVHFLCLKPYVWPQYKGSEFYGLNCYPMCFRWDIFTSSVRYLRFPVDIRLVIPVISVHSGVDFRCVFESKYLIFSIDLENFT